MVYLKKKFKFLGFKDVFFEYYNIPILKSYNVKSLKWNLSSDGVPAGKFHKKL